LAQETGEQTSHFVARLHVVAAAVGNYDPTRAPREKEKAQQLWQGLLTEIRDALVLAAVHKSTPLDELVLKAETLEAAVVKKPIPGNRLKTMVAATSNEPKPNVNAVADKGT
jgi:hypothetical protein